MLQSYSFGGNIIQDGTHTENVHSHPLGASEGPSGFTTYFRNNQPFTKPELMRGDARFSRDNPQIKNTYQYGTWKWPTPGKGYFKYNSESATFISSKKK